MRKVFVTCGTSFTEKTWCLPGWGRNDGFNPHDSATWADYPDAAAQYDERYAQPIQTCFVHAARTARQDLTPANLRRLTAELATLVCLLAADGTTDTCLYLLHTTDPAGSRGARWSAAVARDLWPDVEVLLVPIQGLDAGDPRAFQQQGLPGLVTAVINETSREDAVCLAVTGGYKGVLPFLGLLALHIGAEVVYLHRDSPSLIRLPRLSIPIDVKAARGPIPPELGPFLDALTTWR